MLRRNLVPLALILAIFAFGPSAARVPSPPSAAPAQVSAIVAAAVRAPGWVLG